MVLAQDIIFARFNNVQVLFTKTRGKIYDKN